MKVILTHDVLGLGDIGETVKVKPGYARNYLVPRGFAVEMQSKNVKQLQHQVKQIEARKKQLVDEAKQFANKIESAKVELELRVGKGGRVFGSVNSKDISEKLAEVGVEVDRRRVNLSEPIKKIGETIVKVKLHPEVIADLKVVISKLEATKEEEQQEAEEAKKTIEENTSEEVGTGEE